MCVCVCYHPASIIRLLQVKLQEKSVCVHACVIVRMFSLLNQTVNITPVELSLTLYIGMAS